MAAHLRTCSPHRRIARSPSATLALLSLTVAAVICGGDPLINRSIAVVIAQGQSGLAANYPGDVGIETDPSVVFVEKFEETSVANLVARWNDVLNQPSLSFSTDVPAGSPAGSHSLNISSVGGGGSNGGHLYRQMTPGIDDTLYVRYYIKYPTGVNYSHQGVWMGGHNPPVSWPDPQAGTKPVGNDRFSAAAEQIAGTTIFDHYDYWMNMRMAVDGNYWGNRLLNDPTVHGVESQWMCVEHMVKLNNPVTAFNGEHAIWLNGVKISHLGPGFPNGTWLGGNFTQTPAGTPFEGFRWRSDPSLNLNWIWLQNYSPNDPMGVNGNMKFDHVVAAKTYIGCLASGSSAPRPPAPPANVRIVANGTSTTWPNEPAGLTLRTDWGLDQPVPSSGDVSIAGSSGWKVSANAPSGSSRGWTVLSSDSTAPLSASSVYDFVYPQGMVEGNAPSTVYYPGLGAREVYVGFWWKPSSPFDYGPNGNKIAFIFNGGGGAGGQQFIILMPDGKLRVLPEYPGDYVWRTSNVNATFVTLGAWHRIEWYSNVSTGTNKWWLDGVLQGSYTNVTNSFNFDMFQFSPTWGGNTGAQKRETDHYWFDHVRISAR